MKLLFLFKNSSVSSTYILAYLCFLQFALGSGLLFALFLVLFPFSHQGSGLVGESVWQSQAIKATESSLPNACARTLDLRLLWNDTLLLKV